jgi:hypothetical protein
LGSRWQPAQASRNSQKKNRQKTLFAATALGWMLAVAAVVLAAMYAKRLTLAQQLVRAQIERPAAFDFAFVISGAPMVSPDGQQIAFVALKNNKTAIFCSMVKYGEGRATGRHGRRHIPLLFPRREVSALFSPMASRERSGLGVENYVCEQKPTTAELFHWRLRGAAEVWIYGDAPLLK